ncbi:MAG: single-stranded DNA-binding protein [Pseudomonadota bacterium]
MSVNKVILIGRLGSDPEVRYTSDGTAVATFRIATTKKWSNQQGEKEEKTEWHRIVAWRRLGEICGEYLSKGKQVYIEGELQTRSWEDKDGNKRWATEVVASSMQMLGSPADQDRTGKSFGGGSNQDTGFDTEDDIPF